MALLQDQFLEISAKMVHGNYEANMFLIVLFLKKTENLGGEEEANLLLRLCPNLKEETGRKAREKTAFSWCPISTHCNGEKETSICAHRDDFDHSPHLSELAGFMKSGAY